MRRRSRTFVIDLAALAVPGGSPVTRMRGSTNRFLSRRACFGWARRFQANAADRRNKMTDGRMAVARMIGFGPDARYAHLGLIELANSLCRPGTSGM